jgi:flagellar hook-length control protein FliK
VLIPMTSTAPSPNVATSGMAGASAGGLTANSNGNTQGDNPFAALMALLGGSTIEAQPALNGNGTEVPDEGAAILGDGTLLGGTEGEALLADVIEQLEDGQPLDADMLETLDASGLVGPELMTQLQSQVVASGPALAATAKPVTTLPTTGNLQQPVAPAIDPAGQTPIAGQNATPTEDIALVGNPSTSAQPVPAPADTDPLPAAQPSGTLSSMASTAATSDQKRTGQTGVPQAAATANVEADDALQNIARTQPQPADDLQVPTQTQARPETQTLVQPDQRRTIGGDAPKGFLASLAQGQGADTGQNGAAKGNDTLSALRAALQRGGEQSATSTPGAATTAASIDAMLAGDGSFNLQDFDIQLGGRPLEALGQTGAPKSVTVTSNGTQLPTQQLALTVATEARAGTRRFEIRLDPPEMGRIDVKLEMQADGSIRSMMTVERPDTYDALNRDARQLERLLTQSGLKLGEGGLQLSMGDTGNDQQRSEGQSDQRQQGSALASGTLAERKSDAADELAAQSTMQNGMSGDGAVDIRI